MHVKFPQWNLFTTDNSSAVTIGTATSIPSTITIPYPNPQTPFVPVIQSPQNILRAGVLECKIYEPFGIEINRSSDVTEDVDEESFEFLFSRILRAVSASNAIRIAAMKTEIWAHLADPSLGAWSHGKVPKLPSYDFDFSKFPNEQINNQWIQYTNVTENTSGI